MTAFPAIGVTSSASAAPCRSNSCPSQFLTFITPCTSCSWSLVLRYSSSEPSDIFSWVLRSMFAVNFHAGALPCPPCGSPIGNLAYSSGRFRGRYVSCISQPLAQARVIVFEAGGCYVLR